MTTIAANLVCMAADQFVSYAPSYHGESKIWIAKGRIWGAAGDVEHCNRFKDWTLGKGKRPKVTDPEDKDGAKFEALCLSPAGLFLYVNDSPPDPVMEPYYAIGSGAGYAVGAMSMGASLEEAINVAAKWDSGTRLPYNAIALIALKRRRG